MTTMLTRRRAAAARRGLADLPHDLVARILVLLDGTARDLAAANAASRLFHAAPPGGCSPVEHALRERARARGHECALPSTLSAGVGTWAEELFSRERVIVLARAHSPPVAAGYGFSAFVDAEGGLHTCGEEVVEEEDEDGELMVESRAHVAIGHHDGPGVLVPTHVASLSAVRVVAVAAGGSHLLALSEAGTVYGCGYNDYGQLGLGDTEDRRYFALIDRLRAACVVGISAGASHSLALSAAGCAYSWGDNDYGQLGHGDEKARWEPTRIEALDGVRIGGVAAGDSYTLLLSIGGAVYSCGAGHLGRLGHGDEQDQHTPRRIEALAGVRAVHVSAGSDHSLVADVGGGVSSFGSGLDDQLGYAPGVGAHGYRSLPGRIEALAGVNAVRTSCGYDSSAVLGADGSVYTFGNNGNGQLRDANYFDLSPGVSAPPRRVTALACVRVLWCALCETHALFVGADGSAYSCGRVSAALGRGDGETEDGETDPTPQRLKRLPRLASTLR